MSSITFEAIIDSVHIDPKKGVVKIALIADSRVSLDKLTTLGPRDEQVRVRLESEQTKIEAFPHATLGEEEAEKLKAAAERLSGEEEGAGDSTNLGDDVTITEFPPKKEQDNEDD